MATDQGRKPPAYMVYPAAMMADLNYRQMSLAGRGFKTSLENECWVNLRLPSDPDKLARILGFSAEEVRRLLPEVMPFFAIDGDFLMSPELENYRAYIARIRAAQSDGGTRGSAVTNRKRKSSKSRADKGVESDPASKLQVTREYTRESLDKSKPNQSRSTPSLDEGSPSADAWVQDYSEGETQFVATTADAYRRASRGQ